MGWPYKTTSQNVIDFIEHLETKPTGVTLCKKAIDTKLLDTENHKIIGFGVR